MTIIYAFRIFLFLLISFDGDQTWKKSLDKDDIVIYTRKVESSPFHEFLAETEMKGTKEKFRALITDFDHYSDWSPDCKSIELIEQNAPENYIYHMKLKVPFPFSKRDIVQELILKENESELLIKIVNHPNKIDDEDDVVRMKRGEGEWLVKQISQERVSIRFQYLADPGGDIPAWLVNSFIVKNPYKSLRNIKKIMAD
jgi:hypothetical protein